jgi:hypothetical protein
MKRIIALNLYVADVNFYSTENRTQNTFFLIFLNLVKDLLAGHDFFYRLSLNRSLTNSKEGAVMLSIQSKQWGPLRN